jgi:amino acid transporter
VASALSVSPAIFPDLTVTANNFNLAVHHFNSSSFVTTYFPIPFFAVLFLGYKFVKKSKLVDYKDMDFVTGTSIEMPADPPLKGVWKKLATNV